MRKIVLFIGLNAMGLFAFGQTSVAVERIAPPPVVLNRPLISDSTLLLLDPDLVWRCEQDGNMGKGTFFEVDFEHVLKCECRKELYQLVLGDYEQYEYRPTSRTLRAKLKRTAPSEFLYTEVAASDSTRVIRTVPLFMDFAKQASVDSMYTVDPETGDLSLRISKFVELREKP